MNEHRVGTFCPEHGINCKVDDDGTCSACGASAVGPALDEIERLAAEIAGLRYAIIQARDALDVGGEDE